MEQKPSVETVLAELEQAICSEAAKRGRNREEREDLEQEARLAIVRCYPKWRLARGGLRTFFYPFLVGAMRHAFRDTSEMIRIPRELWDAGLVEQSRIPVYPLDTDLTTAPSEDLLATLSFWREIFRRARLTRRNITGLRAWRKHTGRLAPRDSIQASRARCRLREAYASVQREYRFLW